MRTVRALAPEARIPYISVILAEAYDDAGLSPQQFVEAMPNLRPDTNWAYCTKRSGFVGRSAA